MKRNGCFYLGENQEGLHVYLQKPSWDCGWYWGFGYVKEFRGKKQDYETHTHFDSLFLEHNIFDSYKRYFKTSVLNDEKIWLLLGFMKEFYISKNYAELLQYGNYITSKAKNILDDKNKEANQKEAERINKVLLPELFEKIECLFI